MFITGANMNCYKIDYKILGNELQIVEVELNPMETVIAEAGVMNYMDDGISFSTKMGDGSNPREGFLDKMTNTGTRIPTGELLFLTHFTNTTGDKKRLSFSAPYPGKIFPVEMNQYENELVCQKDTFLAAAFGTQISITFHKKLMDGLFREEGFTLQRIKGSGVAFLHGGGTIIRKELRGNTIRVDTGCLMAFTKGINYSIRQARGIKSMLFAKEEFFLATLRGQGIVWLHSLPLSRLAERILRNIPFRGGRQAEVGSTTVKAGKLF